MKKPPRGIRASTHGKWLLSPSAPTSRTASSPDLVERDYHHMLPWRELQPGTLAAQRLAALVSRPGRAPDCRPGFGSIATAEIAREQARRIADKYITRSGELIVSLARQLRIGLTEDAPQPHAGGRLGPPPRSRSAFCHRS
jgi:hypothetical protein